MLFVVEGAGNHSNRLFQNAHFESLCIEMNFRYFNPTINPILKFYNAEEFAINKFYKKILHRFINRNIIGTIDFNTESDASLKANQMISLLKRKKVVAVKGWYYWNGELLRKHRSYFQQKYQLKQEYQQAIELYQRYKQFDMVVGLHIRRGDYKEWENGKFYYEDEVYIKTVNHFLAELSNKKTLCIVFSNEEVNKETIGSSICADEVVFSNEPWYADHFLMSQCDYLVGPPSTFTMWASFMGKAKYFHIKEKEVSADLSAFCECTG